MLSRMLEARKELANLLGFATWADYITGDKMIGTRQAAGDFIQKIATAADDRLTADYKALLARKQRDTPAATSVDAWDSAYLQELVKADQLPVRLAGGAPVLRVPARQAGRDGSDEQDVRHHVPRRCPTRRCGTRTSRRSTCSTARALLGRIYLDMYPRDDKYKHYAQFTLINGKADRELPEGVLVCNFPQPGAEPALMQHGDVETFFHEFGHLLHHVFGGHTRWAGISGVATEWDFVEAPSQMLEEWVWTPETLQTFARHYQTERADPGGAGASG